MSDTRASSAGFGVSAGDTFLSDTISASAIPSLSSPFVSDTLFGCTAVLSASSPGGALCCLTRCLARGRGCLTCARTHAGPEVVRERVRATCEDARRAHIATLRVALHTPLLAPVLQVMADERTGGTDLSGDGTRRSRRLGRPDLLQHRPPPPLYRVAVCRLRLWGLHGLRGYMAGFLMGVRRERGLRHGAVRRERGCILFHV